MGILKGTLNKLPNPNIILNVITLKEAKESSEIENIITTYDELYKEMILKDKSNPNAKEVLNYRSAINLGNRLVQEKNMITTNMINEIHHLIEPNKGDIRKQKGTVIMNTKTGEILHTPPQTYEEIMEYLKNLEEFINLENKVNPLIKMALIHLQFEMIHPYYDGNGRTGRVLNLMYLKLSDKLDIPILYLSKYIIENRNEYYNLLNRAGKSEENILEFIIYMLKAIEKTSKYTLTLIDNIIEAMENTKKTLKEKLPKIYSKDLLELLFFEFYTKNEYIRNNYRYTFVDTITDAGAVNKIVSDENFLRSIEDKVVLISVNKHKSDHIFVAGHSDCAGCQTSDETQKKYICQAAEKMHTDLPHEAVTGLFVYENGEIEVLVDYDMDFK